MGLDVCDTPRWRVRRGYEGKTDVTVRVQDRPVNEPDEHERGLFMIVCLSLNEHEHLTERKIMFVFVHLAHEDVRVRSLKS